MKTNWTYVLAVAAISNLVLSVSFGMSAYGQPGSTSFDSIPGQKLQIVNPTNVPVRFQISCNDRANDWDEQSLEANTNAQYSCTGSTSPKLYFQMTTSLPSKPQQRVEYTLDWKERYELEFDESAGRWDIRKIAR